MVGNATKGHNVLTEEKQRAGVSNIDFKKSSATGRVQRRVGVVGGREKVLLMKI